MTETLAEIKTNHVLAVARSMASAPHLPLHLQGKVSKGGQITEHYSDEQKIAQLMQIVELSVRWDMPPHAVANSSYSVHGKMGFTGVIVAGVVNAQSGFPDGLKFITTGEGDNMIGVMYGSREEVTEQLQATLKSYLKHGDKGDALTELVFAGVKAIRLTVKQARPSNGGNEMWVRDTHQKLFYSGVTKFARRHFPDLLLGIHTTEDLEHITVDAMVGSTRARIADVKSQFSDADIDVQDAPRLTQEPPRDDPPTPKDESLEEPCGVPPLITPSPPAAKSKNPNPKKYTGEEFSKVVRDIFANQDNKPKLDLKYSEFGHRIESGGCIPPDDWEIILSMEYDERAGELESV